MRYKFLCSAAVLAFLVTIGCNSGETTPTTSNNNSTAGNQPDGTRPSRPAWKAPPRAPAVGQMAPEITGQDTDGTVFNLSEYRGKVVMIDFWGDW